MDSSTPTNPTRRPCTACGALLMLDHTVCFSDDCMRARREANDGREPGSSTGEHGHQTASANDSVLRENGYYCAKCSSRITSFDDHGFVFSYCPACDRTLHRSLINERKFEIAEEKRARGW